MLEALKTKRAWTTQRLANRFPPWSKVRRLGQSIGQQILEPIGREFEDIYWWSNYNLGNSLVNTSDINQIDGIYRLSLPANFEWETEQHADGVVYSIPSLVRGKTDSGWVTLSQAQDNSLEEFWYGVPSRIDLAGESYTYRSVVSSTQVSGLSVVSPVSPPIASKLWITLSNNGPSIKNYKGKAVRSSVSISGRDIHGVERTEKVYFGFNGSVLTKHVWSEVLSVETEYIDDIAYVRVDWLSIGQSEYLDTFGLQVSDSREKFRFWTLGSRIWGSTLQHSVFSADDLTLVQEGEDSKHAEYEIQLLDTSGDNISALDMNPWPKRRWIIIADDSYLHFFFPGLQIENLDSIALGTTESVVQIEIDKEWCCQGDTVTLDYNMKRPFVRVLRTRLSVEKPDGTRVCIDSDGNEQTFSSDQWVNHLEGTTFQRVGYQGNNIYYEVESFGRYVFFLESLITDILDTEGQTRPTTHMDVRVLHSSYDNALASLSLPISVGSASLIAFDSYHRPWIINSGGTAHRLTFHYDQYLSDFQNKAIIVREPYSEIEVLA